MTDNISRMYELAKVEKRQFSGVIKGDYPMRFHDVGYPPFTDTKQLELTKWIQINKYKQYLHFVDLYFPYFRGLKFVTEETKRKFVASEYPKKLAKTVCELWEDLTDKQREEVRGILQ